MMKAVVTMVSVNIFRDFTPPRRKNNNPTDCFSSVEQDSAWPRSQRKENVAVKDQENIDLEEDESVLPDPAWPHLQIVYEVLLRFVTSQEANARVLKTYIDRSFILKLLELFNSENPKERDLLKVILHRIYKTFLVHRPFIRKTINNILYQLIHESGKHNGVAEFLEILGSIIDGFALPLKEEHKIFLEQMLIPLHKSNFLVKYHVDLSYCLVGFVKKDCKLAGLVIAGLVKYWPVINSSKELLFLVKLENFLEVIQETEFEQFIVPVFKKVSRCLSSSHARVAERAALFCANENVVKLIKQNRKTILPIIFPALERSARGHWDLHVCELISGLRDFFYDMDQSLFTACQAKFLEDKSKEHEIKEIRMVTWRNLEELAAEKPNETCQVACSSSALEDLTICSSDTSIVPELQQMSELESGHTDWKFDIVCFQAEKKVRERKLVRSKSDNHDRGRTKNELQITNAVIEKELEDRNLEILDLLRTNGELHRSNEVTEMELERRNKEIRDMQSTYNELHSVNKVIDKELERSRMILRVVLFAVMFYLLSMTCYRNAVSLKTD